MQAAIPRSLPVWRMALEGCGTTRETCANKKDAATLVCDGSFVFCPLRYGRPRRLRLRTLGPHQDSRRSGKHLPAREKNWSSPVTHVRPSPPPSPTRSRARTKASKFTSTHSTPSSRSKGRRLRANTRGDGVRGRGRGGRSVTQPRGGRAARRPSSKQSKGSQVDHPR